jgi:hypothetical protein
MYTRVGRSAYAELVRNEVALANLLDGVPERDQANALGVLVFHAEGSVLDRELASPASAALKTAAESLEARIAGLPDEPRTKAVKRWLARNGGILSQSRATALSTYLPSIGSARG